MSENEMDRDAIYAEGHRDGYRDCFNLIKKEFMKVKRLQEHLEAILKDPEKLVDLALHDEDVNTAITSAVVVLLMETKKE